MTRLSKNILYNIIGQSLLLFLSFIAVKYIYGQLGGDALGIIYFTSVMNMMLTAVLQVGVSSTTVREVSAHLKHEPGYIHDLMRTASFLYWGAFVLVGLGIYFLAPFLVEKWITLSSMSRETAVYVLRVLGIASFVALPKSFYAAMFNGLQRMEFNNIIDVSTSGLQQLGTVLVLFMGGTLYHVVYWFAGCYVLRVVAYIISLVRFFGIRALVPGFSYYVVKRNREFASKMVFVSIARMIFSQFDKLIISKLMPVAMVGYYGFAYGTVSKGTLISNSISQAAYPSFSRLFKSGDRKGLLAQYRKLHDLVCFSTVPVFAAIPFALLPVFTYVFDGDTAHMLFFPTVFLCVGFYMTGTLIIPHFIILASGKPELLARMNLLALFAVLPVMASLVYFFGLAGAGLSVLYHRIFMYIYIVPRVCRVCLDMPVSRWYAHVTRILVLTCLSYGLAWVVLKLAGLKTVLALVSAYLGASALFLAGAYFMIGQELRQSIYQNFLLIKGERSA